MLNIEPTSIDEVVVITPKRFADDRGYFSEVFNKASFDSAIPGERQFVQDNESLSRQVGTIRGMHFQVGGAAQGKLVRVLAGRLLDVCIDLRKSSTTFGQHVGVELDVESGRQLWVPPGFAHGFCTLEPNTVIGYKTTGYYDAASDRSLLWNDSQVAIEWPEVSNPDTLSAKDLSAPTLKDLESAGDLYE